MPHPSLLAAVAAVAALAAALAPAAPAAEKGPKITKCQDATGKWHYGDSAAAECARSKITVMSEKGVTRKEIAAPPTEAELKEREARREEEERARVSAEDQKKKDALLLVTYGHEDDIIFVRDRKLAQVDAVIKGSEGTLGSLRAVLTRLEKQAEEEQKGGKPVSPETTKQIEQTRRQMAGRESEIAAKRKEQDDIRRQADADLQRYRELKKESAKAAPAAKP
jgi:hypothetical protein